MTIAHQWLPTSLVAELHPEPLTDRTIRNRIASGRYGAEGDGWIRERGSGSGKLKIALASLSSEERALYWQQHPLLAPAHLSIVRDDAQVEHPPSLAFDNLPDGSDQKRRAIERKAICDAFELVLADWDGRGGLTNLKRRFCKLRKIGFNTLERWLSAYRTHGIDGLVDRNDGSSRRGKTVIPRRVREFFEARYTDGTEPTVRQAITEARWFSEREMNLDISWIADDAFYRVIGQIPEAVKRATRGDQDDEERVILTLRRDHNFPALHIVVADHHLTDRWVHCGEGGYVKSGDRLVQIPAGRICGPEGCKAGHRVWITTFMDVSSRRVLSTIISLNYPTSDTVRRGLRLLIERHGIPNILYCDNGKDFKSAFGRAIRRREALPIDEDFTNNLLASLGIRVIFAIPRRARSKNIERLFRTWVMQIWQGHASYVGALGKRKEAAEDLRKTPHELIGLEEFTEECELQIELYNEREGHRGQGMRGRSPRAVFDATRIPRRDPEAQGFAIAFWTWKGRQVHAGGTVTVGEDRYLLDRLVGGDLIGKNVQLLINPDDIRRAIVLSGCEHTNSKHARSQALRCGCAGKGVFLCEASLFGLSSHDDEAITAAAVGEMQNVNRELRRRIRSFASPTAQRDLAAFKANRMHLLRSVLKRTVTRREEAQMAAGAEPASSPSLTVMLPQSGIARRLSEYRAQIDSGAAFPAAPSIPEETLDRMLRAPRLVPSLPATAIEDEEDLAAERVRVRRERLRLAGLCVDGCGTPITAAVDDAEHCGPHWLAHFGSDLEPMVRQHIETVMEEER